MDVWFCILAYPSTFPACTAQFVADIAACERRNRKLLFRFLFLGMGTETDHNNTYKIRITEFSFDYADVFLLTMCSNCTLLFTYSTDYKRFATIFRFEIYTIRIKFKIKRFCIVLLIYRRRPICTSCLFAL